ncbi:MAG: methionyl-tRNA formyltransferase [Actinomycetota bacterium]
MVFLGNDRWSVPSLEALASSRHDVALVLTRTPRPARRGMATDPTPVATAARDLLLPLVETPSLEETEGPEAIRNTRLDVLVVVAFGEILSPVELGLAPRGAENVHFSLLPRYRGASPVQRALIDGLASTGVTTMLLDEGMDTGPILLQREASIGETDDAGVLGGRLAVLGADLLIATLDAMEDGSLEPRPQDPAKASTAPRLTAADRVLDWSRPAAEVVGRIRAFAPEPGARTGFRGAGLKVVRAEVVAASGEPGALVFPVDGEPGGPLVAAGTGGVRLVEVAPAGRKHMDAEAFWRGVRPHPGETLG